MDEMLMPWPASREGLKWGHSLSFGLGQHSAAMGLTASQWAFRSEASIIPGGESPRQHNSGVPPFSGGQKAIP